MRRVTVRSNSLWKKIVMLNQNPSRSLVVTLLMTLGLTVPLLTAVTGHAAVWKTQQTWTPEWEERYSAWVKKNWDTQFFAQPGTAYSDLKLDCADVVYSMRIIFAAENGLPFAIKDPSGGKTPITQAMSRFDTIPEQGGKRVRAFLNYIFSIAGTASIPSDTYPVKPDPSGIRSGTLLLTDKESHHSWTIKDITPEGLPHLIFSSRPAKTGLLSRVGYPSMEFTFPKGVIETRHAGFRAFRLPEEIGKPVWEAKGYSREQYEIPAQQWRETIQARMATRTEDENTKIQRLWKEACTNTQDRVTAVNEGLAFLATYPEECLDPKSYDDYSTPNRDLRLKNSYQDLESAIRNARESKALLSSETLEMIAEFEASESEPSSLPPSSESGISSSCSVKISPTLTLSLAEVRKRSYAGLLSSNPHDPLNIRWGQAKGPSPRAQKCPVY